MNQTVAGRTGRVLAGVLLLATAIGAGGARAQGQAGGASDAAAALAALDRGDAAAARPGLTLSAAEALWNLALAESGEARAARLQSCSALAPEGSWVRAAAAGLQAMAAEKPAEAATAFRAALAMRPDKRVQKLLGDALRTQGDVDGALEAYLAATAIDPTYAASLVATGDLKREKNDFAGAYNAYNHALDEQGRPFAALLGRASARLYLSDEEGTLADLARAREVARTAAERARAELALLYAHVYWRTVPQGLDAAERAVAIWEAEKRPDSAAGVCNAVGRVLLETGESSAAEVWYDRAWQLADGSAMKPEEKTIWKVRHLHAQARIAAQRREFRRAEALATEMRTLMDSDAANAEHYAVIYPYLMGYIRLQERKYDEAIAFLRQAETDRAFIQYLLGEAYARSRDRANARIWYEKALASGAGLDLESAVVRPQASAWLAKNPAGS